MTIEELTFAAFQQGREQGREESAAQIDELKNRLSVLDEFRVASQNKLIAANEQHCEQLQAIIASQASQIERLTNAANNLMSAHREYRTFRPDENCEDWEDERMRLYCTLNLAEAELSAALQPKEGEE